MLKEIIFMLKRKKFIDEDTVAIYYDKKTFYFIFFIFLYCFYMSIRLILLGDIASILGLFMFFLFFIVAKIIYRNVLYPLAIFTELYISDFNKKTKIYFQDMKDISIEHDSKGRTYLYIKMNNLNNYDSTQYSYDYWNEDTIIFGLSILDYNIDKEKILYILKQKIKNIDYKLIEAFQSDEEYK